MGRINGIFIKYEPHYHKMIGDKDLTPEEAYRIFYNFLREFKFIGTFHWYMNKMFGSFSQLYKTYFIERVTNYKAYCDRINHVRKVTDFYHWYRDIVLLFPFAYVDNDYNCYTNRGCISYTKVKYIEEMWELYCQEQKLIYSEIQIKKENEENIDNVIENWEKILENCGYSV